MSNIPVITIDGPSGVGKGTVSLRLAKHLGWHTLDSGAMYRILALSAQRHHVSLTNENALARLADDLNIQFSPIAEGIHVILEGKDVSQEIRLQSTGTVASRIAVLPAVRHALLSRQRAFLQAPGLIAEGRDMGTVVFPNASNKFFLTATPEERANRRYKQLKEKEIHVNISSIITEITERDERDSTRSTAPLIAATDAHVIDTSVLTIEKVVTCILRKMLPRSTGSL
ncbi:MAG: (d)CMP kinase [Thiomargarita sp.]|nr:(d)CMP kinase [Thiomargarita sp.]